MLIIRKYPVIALYYVVGNEQIAILQQVYKPTIYDEEDSILDINGKIATITYHNLPNVLRLLQQHDIDYIFIDKETSTLLELVSNARTR